MSKIKFSPELFLETAELNRLKRFLDDDGFRNLFLQITDSFGLIKKANSAFTNGLIQEYTGLTLSHNAITAFDKNGNVIVAAAATGIAVPQDNEYYWVKIKYKINLDEIGTYSIDTAGNLVCTSGNGQFLSILRGQPDFPSRVKFTNATNNTLEYDVEDVTNDNNAVLQGTFTSESDLTLSVIGTFTPGTAPSTNEKQIFQYDSYELSLVLESSGEPSKLDGEEFWLARVRVDTSGTPTLIIEDKRLEYWKTVPDFKLSDIEKTGNPVIGVEQITYDHANSPKDRNIVQLAWCLRTTSFTVNPKTNKIVISGALGGKFKASNFFSIFNPGDFDGWRVYTETGEHYRITNSVLSGSNIELTVDQLDYAVFSANLSQQLLICPNAEEIEIVFSPISSATNKITNIRVTYPINTPYLKEQLLVYSTNNSQYYIQYRYKQAREYSVLLDIPNDAVGYYNESQFDSNGTLIVSPVQTPQTGSTIPLTLKSDAYITVITNLITGDKYGVNETTLDAGITLIQLTVGDSYQYQRYSGSLVTLTDNIFINLNKFLDPPTNTKACRNGNNFIIHIKQQFDLDTVYKIKIVQDFINTGSFTLLKDIDLRDQFFNKQSEQGLYLNCTYDGTSWIINNVNEAKLVNRTHSLVVNVSGLSYIPPTNPIVGYELVASFPALEYDLEQVFVAVGFEFATSNGGAGALASVGVGIKKNGGVSYTGTRIKVLPQELFINNYNMTESFNLGISGTYVKGDVIEVWIATAASFTPILSLSNVSAMLTGKITNF